MPPYAHSLVSSSTSHSLAIWTPVNGEDLVVMTGKIHNKLSSPHIPHFERGVFGCRDQKTRVSGEAALIHCTDVATQRGDESIGKVRLDWLEGGLSFKLTFHPSHSRV